MSDLSPEAEELLKRARASFSPDEARIAALRAAVGAKLAPSVPSKGPAGGAAKGAGIGTATKLAGVGVLLVASAVGARMLAGRTHRESPIAAMASASPAMSSLSREQPRVEPWTEQAPPSIAIADLPPAQPGRAILLASPPHGHSAIKESARVVPMSSTSLARTLPREVSPAEPEAPRGSRPVSDARGSGRGGPVTATVIPLGAPSQENEVVAEPPVVPAPTVSAPRSVDVALGEEVSLLRAARRALDGGDAMGALILLDRYARAYPNGTMQEESLATRALTLCALGHVVAAKDAARRLEAVAPRSPHLMRVRASCAGGETRPE
jgi:hypothetical protein